MGWTGWERWWARVDGRTEELLLEAIEFAFELDDIESLILARENDLKLIEDLRVFQ